MSRPSGARLKALLNFISSAARACRPACGLRETNPSPRFKPAELLDLYWKSVPPAEDKPEALNALAGEIIHAVEMGSVGRRRGAAAVIPVIADASGLFIL